MDAQRWRLLAVMVVLAGCTPLQPAQHGLREPGPRLAWCYRTLADVSCYAEPDPGRESRFVGSFDFHPDVPWLMQEMRAREAPSPGHRRSLAEVRSEAPKIVWKRRKKPPVPSISWKPIPHRRPEPIYRQAEARPESVAERPAGAGEEAPAPAAQAAPEAATGHLPPSDPGAQSPAQRSGKTAGEAGPSASTGSGSRRAGCGGPGDGGPAALPGTPGAGCAGAGD